MGLRVDTIGIVGAILGDILGQWKIKWKLLYYNRII